MSEPKSRATQGESRIPKGQQGRHPGYRRGQPTWPYGSAEQVAELCDGIALRTVRAYVQGGILPTPERPGWHHLPQTAAAYWAYRFKARGDETVDDADTRYACARADLKELEADALATSLIPYAHAELITTTLVAVMRGECDGNAGRLGPLVRRTESDAEARRMLLDEYRAVCDRAARKIAELREPVRAAANSCGDDVDAPAPEDGG